LDTISHNFCFESMASGDVSGELAADFVVPMLSGSGGAAGGAFAPVPVELVVAVVVGAVAELVVVAVAVGAVAELVVVVAVVVGAVAELVVVAAVAGAAAAELVAAAADAGVKVAATGATASSAAESCGLTYCIKCLVLAAISAEPPPTKPVRCFLKGRGASLVKAWPACLLRQEGFIFITIVKRRK